MNTKGRKRARRNAQLATVTSSVQQTWFGDDVSYAQYRDNVERMQKANQSDFKLGSWDEDDDQEDGTADENFAGDYGYMLTKHGNVAVLQVYGELVPKESWYNRYFGMISYEEIRNAAITAASSGSVAGLLIDYDTGGGAVTGIGELSDFLREFDNNVMPVYSYTGANMLSAGYWLGCVGRKVFCSSMALSGSIGVITAHFSYARAMKEQGIDVTMFRQGEFKALGSPYETLDAKAKADIESRMRKFYDMFLGHVSPQRGIPIPTLLETAAEGRVFMGDDAVKVGLVDKVISFDKAVAFVANAVKDTQLGSSLLSPTTMAGMTDMKRTLNAAGLAAVASGVAAEVALADPKLSEEVIDTPTETDPTKVDAKVDADGKPIVEAKVDADGKPIVETPAPAASDKPAVVETDTKADTSMLDRLVLLSAQLATAQAELATLKTADATKDAQFKALVKIAADSTNRMEVPLARTPTNLKEASAELVLSTYHSVISAFNSQFKVGGVAEVPSSDDLKVDAPAMAYIPDASLASL